jgi:hypothetical protein
MFSGTGQTARFQEHGQAEGASWASASNLDFWKKVKLERKREVHQSLMRRIKIRSDQTQFVAKPMIQHRDPHL